MYLVVVDGICNPREFISIKRALPCNSLGSRAITTTRLDDVAEYCYRGYDIYDMRLLSTDDSLMLLHGRIFGSQADCPPHLLEISYKIWGKCRGHPLAISIISSLLAYKPRTGSAWEGVCNAISIDCASSLYKENGEGMRKVLSLCYHDLRQI